MPNSDTRALLKPAGMPTLQERSAGALYRSVLQGGLGSVRAAATVRAKIRSNVLGGKDLRYGGVKLLKASKQPVYATFTGQFFYDDWHIGDAPRGKKGCKSPTIAEMHPIMAVQFPEPPR